MGDSTALQTFQENLAAWELYDKRLATSLCGLCNVSLVSCGHLPVASDTVRRWVFEFLPEYAIQPVLHPRICDTCDIYDFVIESLTNRKERMVTEGVNLVLERIITGIQAVRFEHLRYNHILTDCLKSTFLRQVSCINLRTFHFQCLPHIFLLSTCLNLQRIRILDRLSSIKVWLKPW